MTQTPPDPATTIDVSGLPEPLVLSLRKLVEEYRIQTAPPPPVPRKPLRGRFAQTGVTFSKEEIDEAQKEMWAGFPRDLPDGEGAPS